MIRICGARHPSGLVCTCPEGHGEHQAWDHAQERYVLWPAEERKPVPRLPPGRLEGNAREDAQAGARYDYDRGREAWRPAGDDRMHWWVR